MQKSNEVVIDKNLTLQKIMNQKKETPLGTTQQPTNLYELLNQTVKETQENTKTKKKPRAKAKAIAKVAPQLPQVQDIHQKAQVQAAINNEKPINKESLILKINKYQTSKRFGTFITKELKINQSRDQLIKLSIDRLQNILHRIRINLNNRNMDKIFENMAITCAQGYENTITTIGYDISGFSDLLTSNPGFWDAFERWKIEKTDMPEIPPSFQLLYIITATTITAHSLNTSNIQENNNNNNEKSKSNVKEKIIIDNDDKESFSVGKNI